VNNKRLLIVGAGTFGRTIQEAAMLSGYWSECCFLDDSFPSVSTYDGYSIIGTVSDIGEVVESFNGLVVAIGNNHIRKELLNKFLDLNYPVVSLIHPRAYVSERATIGRGSLIMAGAVVGAHASLGIGCILNPNSVCDHDCNMANFSHLGVGCVMAGTTSMEEGAWLRAGVGISYGTVVPAWSVLEPKL
jgi:sugar O-acyltransferase (sialic acid O-acetyltransferase NeuD family)